MAARRGDGCHDTKTLELSGGCAVGNPVVVEVLVALYKSRTAVAVVAAESGRETVQVAKNRNGGGEAAPDTLDPLSIADAYVAITAAAAADCEFNNRIARRMSFGDNVNVD
jgi:hypothetical protein